MRSGCPRGGWHMGTDFGERLKAAIVSADMRQYVLAARVGVSAGMISHYVNGRSMPSLQTMVKLAKALGVSTDYLLRGE